jgi:hypothetical protein
MTRFIKSLLLLTLWIFVTAFGNVVGLAIGFGFTHSDVDWVITLPIGIAVSGVLVGVGQWAVLSIQFKKVWLWVPLTTLGLLLGYFLGFLAYGWLYPNWAQLPVMSIVAGTVLGALQWPVLYKKVEGSLWWIPVSMLSWSIGEDVSLKIFDSVDFSRITWADNMLISGVIIGMVLGILVGIISGASIIFMMRRHHENGRFHKKEVFFVKNAS